jgi:hypothetical protein
MDSPEVDIAVDFMDMTDDRRLWTRLADVREGLVPIAGSYAVVGDEDAEPAVAQLVSVSIEQGITLRVFDGSIDDHRHLLTST